MKQIYMVAEHRVSNPEYIVFCNGRDYVEDRKILYLSYSFWRGSGCLECICEVINIGSGIGREEAMKMAIDK